MRILLRLVLLIVLLAAAFWVLRAPILEQLGANARAAARQAERGAREGLSGVDLDPHRIAAELARTGRVVRRKATNAVRRLDASTRDARTRAKLEARYALDPELRARDIDVEVKDGLATLSGRVDTPEDVARAIRMALEEENIVEVTATLRVRQEGRASS